MAHKVIHAFVSCALLLPASAGVAAASGPAACPAGGTQLAGVHARSVRTEWSPPSGLTAPASTVTIAQRGHRQVPRCQMSCGSKTTCCPR